MTRRMVMAATLALSVGAVSLLAQGPGPSPGRGPGGMGPGGPGGPPGILAMVNRLEDLTDAQREQLRALAEEGRQGGNPGAGVRAVEIFCRKDLPRILVKNSCGRIQPA